MAKELLSKVPDCPSELNQWDDLRISFINFIHVVRCAIVKNEKLIEQDRMDYHRNLEGRT